VEIKCQLDNNNNNNIYLTAIGSSPGGRVIYSSRVIYRWLLSVVFGALIFKLSVWCGAAQLSFKTKAPDTTGSNHLYITLELLMMGIMVPETY
jgi:hypothetical protein